MNPLIPLLIVGGGWWVSSQASLTRTIWLLLNVLDTYKALRMARPNGRRIGQITRKKAMRESLVCWIVYIIVQSFLPACSLLSWLPFYAPLSTALSAVFLFTRLSSSSAFYHSLLTPFIRQYESPIDLTFLLFHSLSTLVLHYTFLLPLSLLWSGITNLKDLGVVHLVERIAHLTAAHSPSANTDVGTAKEEEGNDKPTVDVDALDRPTELSSRSTTVMRSACTPTVGRPKGPRSPRNSLAVHPKASKSSKAAPAEPEIIVVSPPSSPGSIERPHDTATAEAGPSTPHRRRSPSLSVSVSENGMLNLPPRQQLRRSPRKHRPPSTSQPAHATSTGLLERANFEFDFDSLLLTTQSQRPHTAASTLRDPTNRQKPKSLDVPSRSSSVVDLAGGTAGFERRRKGKEKEQEAGVNGTKSASGARMRRAETEANLAIPIGSRSSAPTAPAIATSSDNRVQTRTKPLPRRIAATTTTTTTTTRTTRTEKGVSRSITQPSLNAPPPPRLRNPATSIASQTTQASQGSQGSQGSHARTAALTRPSRASGITRSSTQPRLRATAPSAPSAASRAAVPRSRDGARVRAKQGESESEREGEGGDDVVAEARVGEKRRIRIIGADTDRETGRKRVKVSTSTGNRVRT